VAQPASSPNAYATSDDLATRYDVNVIGDLAGDSKTRVFPFQLATNDRVTKALLDASGQVEAACTAGQMYRISATDPTDNDLLKLTGASLSFLQRIVCDLAMGWLFMSKSDRDGKPPESFKMALEILEQLRSGKLVFGLLEQQAAGNLQHEVEDAGVVERRFGVVVQAERFFGRRSNRWMGPL
jgi:phage gp36-like protein